MSIRRTANKAARISFIFILSVALPAAAHAAVSINEIMYNPAGTDTGREWVELYNSGSSDVTLVGGSGKGSWRIADSSNHTITDPQGGVGRGSLVVPANGYLVITSDPVAFMGEYSGTYSVAKASLSLTNTGTTISLIDGSGATVNSVTYTASQGGQDNGTSLQLASSTWLQALPTPGAANATERYDPPAQESSSSGSSSKSSTTANPGYVSAPVPQVFADAGGDRSVIVGADSKFVATAYDRDQSVINYAKFFWNFGDGSSAEGPWVMHHYSYPGTYAAELTITNTSLRTSSYITVTAQPASVALVPLPRGGVSIKNNAGRNLDVSFWQVKEGDATFTLPEYSMLLKDSAINISASTLGFAAAAPVLYYPDGTEVLPQEAAAATSAPVSVHTQESHVAASPESEISTEASAAAAPLAPASAGPEGTTTAQAASQGPADLQASVAASTAALPLWASVAGLGGIMGLGVASVYAVRRRPATPKAEDEFTIE